MEAILRLQDEWNAYLRIASHFQEATYYELDKIRVSRHKGKWAGGVLYDDKIYGIVNSDRSALVYIPTSRICHTFGKSKVGTFKWTGGCVYNDKIYGFPRKENSLLIIHQQTKEMSEKALSLNYQGEHHYGGIMTPNGIVYQPPRNTDHILRINLNSYETRKIFIPDTKQYFRYSSSVLHPNGNIYFIPEYGGKYALLHIETEEIELFGINQAHLVFGAVVGIDGNIYGFCKEGSGILKINTNAQTAGYICTEIGCPDCYGSVVGINGKIYGIPAGGEKIWEFDVRKQEARILFKLREHGYAKCAGGVLGSDGSIIMIPCFGEYIYCLKTNSPIHAKLPMSFFFHSNY